LPSDYNRRRLRSTSFLFCFYIISKKFNNSLQPKKIITTPHTTLKEEKLSAFLDTGQRNKGEERGEENYQKKRSKERKKEIS
ncbi:MAG: hypothetical protein IJA40_02460, partial [Phascolarctobacterium sp.]|nr:hypothetical protein [Phascolarctobacterium sp.]